MLWTRPLCNIKMEQNDSASIWSINSRIATLRRTNALTDVQFLVGEERESFTCHKLILAAGSEAFRAMFYGNIPANDPVIVPDVTHEAFNIMLEYLYNDKVDFRNSFDAFETAYAAKKYLIKELYIHSENFLLQNFHHDYSMVCNFLERAILLEMRPLKQRCKHYIARKFSKVAYSKDFLDLSKSTLKEILSLNTLNIASESEVAEAMLHWGAHQCSESNQTATSENMRKVLGDLLELIRFPTLTVTELNELAKRFNFLQASENLSILLKIALPSADSDLLKLPQGLGNLTKKRSGTNYLGVDIPLEYRYYGHTSYYIKKHEQAAMIKATGGQATILGIVCAMKGMADYLRVDRCIKMDILLKNSVTKFEFKVSTEMRYPTDLVDPDLQDFEFDDNEQYTQTTIFETPFFIADNESALLTNTVYGEGVYQPQWLQGEVTANINETKIEIKALKSNKEFLLRRVLFM